MIYDQLCGIVERTELNVFRDRVEKAHLFKFPGRPQDLLPSDMEMAEFVKEHFFLPFRTVAVEDDTSVIILHDPEKDSKGLEIERWFLECSPLSPNDVGLTMESNKLLSTSEPWYTVFVGRIISHGYSRETEHHTVHLISGIVDIGYLVAGHKIVETQRSAEITAEVQHKGLVNPKVALEEIIYFNSPDRFVVEVIPARTGRGKGTVKIPRSDDRSTYILLTTKEIKHYINSSHTGQGSAKEPHPRRRHYRTLKSDHWKNKKGETIVVSATWVGPTEAQVGKKLYKIRLDI
jgi:hypothetical protein